MGSRVRDHYGTIKPLIKVNNKTLIEYVIENVWAKDASYVFVAQREHCKDYGLDDFLVSICNKLGNKCDVIQIDGLTSGAAVTCLKASNLITNQKLLIANSDQYCRHFSTNNLFKQMEIDRADAGIVVFEADSPKWSFVKVNQFGLISNVVEKSPISNLATLGYYAWTNGSDFIDMANKMISEDFRVNSEFYVAPTLDYACKSGLIVKAYYSDSCYGTGTIPDVENFKKVVESWES